MTTSPDAIDQTPGAARRSLIAAFDVSVRFGGVIALDHVTFDVAAGEIIGVIGPNGAGKTTLFDVLAGVRRPTSGRVELGGVDVTTKGATWRARRGLRRTFQRQQIFGGLSVRENLLVAQEGRSERGGIVVDVLGLSGVRAESRRRLERVDEVVEQCRLSAVVDVPAGALPIGVARMVELARAIVDQPRVLLLDEPTSGLGSAETELMGSVIDDHVATSQCGVVLVEHDVAFVMDRSHRVVVMNLGAVLASGTPSEVSTNPVVRDAYLG